MAEFTLKLYNGIENETIYRTFGDYESLTKHFRQLRIKQTDYTLAEVFINGKLIEDWYYSPTYKSWAKWE